MKRTIFILDTNVLLHDPQAIYKFKENEILLPIVVVEEIDKFKRDQTEVGRNARTISRLLDQERKKGNLNKGVLLEGGGFLRIIMDIQESGPDFLFPGSLNNNDNRILGLAVFHGRNTRRKCVLITKDTNLRIKADAMGITAEDYTNDKIDIDELYTGFTTMQVFSKTLETLKEKGSVPLLNEGLNANQFVRLVDNKDEEQSILTRVDPDRESNVLLQSNQGAWGITPLNDEQRMAIELLLDPRIKLVSLLGKAGTGKTLMALATGLQMVIDEQKYNRLIVARPIQPLGKDLGFLPGDIDDKYRPWMQPIFDNLEFILHCNSEELGKSQITYQYFIDKGWLMVEPLTYIRGRSIPNQYMLIDEAQNLTPHEIKSIVTRAGHGTKIVLTGDPYQIDNPFLDTTTNGISYLVKRFQNQSLYGHITLSIGERSELAERASNLL